MPIKLASPIYKSFVLEQSDKKYGNDGEPTTVTIRQATQAQHAVRQDLFKTYKQIFNNAEPGEWALQRELSLEVLKATEVWLTICDCNLLDLDGKSTLFPSKKDGNGKPELDMGKNQFMLAWGRLFPDIAQEIHSFVLQVNPQWIGTEGEA